MRHFTLGIAILLISISSFGQNVRNTDFKADQSLKSGARVNPSTRAMEFSIGLGGYAGRGGNQLPVVFSYSSKVWQIEAVPGGSWQRTSGGVTTDVRSVFAKRSAAGWTSGLGVPRIEYRPELYEGPHQGALFEGLQWAPVAWIDTPSYGENYALYYVKRVNVVTPDGSTHEMRASDAPVQCGTVSSPCAPDPVGIYLSVDGTRLRLEVSAAGSVLYTPDGGRYEFGAWTSQGVYGHEAFRFTDRFGNRMTYDSAARRWTDTMGRTIADPLAMNWNAQQNQQPGDVTATFPGFGSGTVSAVFSWRNLNGSDAGESVLLEAGTPLRYKGPWRCLGNTASAVTEGAHLFTSLGTSPDTRLCAVGQDEGAFNPVVLARITLPNGAVYRFRYNAWGEIVKIVHPTGAYERFAYDAVPPVQSSGDPMYDQGNRGVSDRWVSASGTGNDEVHWSYQAIRTVWPSVQPYRVVTNNPDGTRSEQLLLDDAADALRPYGFSDPGVGSPFEERFYSASGQLLRRSLTVYETSGPLPGGHSAARRDMRPVRRLEVSIEPGESTALVSMTETVYDSDSDPGYFAHLNPKTVRAWDYASTDLSTATNGTAAILAGLFSGAAPKSVAETDYLYDPAYKARNVCGLAVEARVKRSDGTVAARSRTFYDEPAYLAYSGPLPASAAATYQNPGTSVRGVATTARTWSDVVADQYIDAHSLVDQYGNVRQIRDAKGADTSVSYSPDYLYAYPTEVTTPAPGGPGTALTTTAVYDFGTGLTTSVTEPNGLTTWFEYADPMVRLTRTTPRNAQGVQVGGSSENVYGTPDANGILQPGQRFAMTRLQIDAQNWKYSYSWFDGLGRASKSQTQSAAGDVFAETEYDLMGRVKRVTNPYRAGDAKQWTESFYDDLGRVTGVITPDGATAQTSYGLLAAGALKGTVVTASDQSGRQRRSVTDALGQLVRVDEPNASGQLGTIANPAQATFYSYDTLGNLTTVAQGQQTRSFTYSSLSRLLTATNPESGTVSYAYDPNGNLTAKTDARGVVTSYAYDALNRVTQRSYSTPNWTPGSGPLANYSATPAVSYTYDDPLVPNSKGRLTKVVSGTNETRYLSFDILGRVTSQQQVTDGFAYSATSYAYNLAGQLTEQTYPSGRVVRNVFDADGDLSQVLSRKNQSSGVHAYASQFAYNAAGAVTSMRLGSGRWESTQFNSRLQPTRIALGSVQGATDLLKLDYEYGDWNGTAVDPQKNNGNLVRQTVTVPNSAAAGAPSNAFTAVQSYNYDQLNRITSAEEKIGTVQQWKQAYTFDRYGNRNFVHSQTTTLPKGCGTTASPLVCDPDKAKYDPSVDPSNNRLFENQYGDANKEYEYDPTGNTVRDAEGRRFTYDADNKQTEVRDAAGNVVGRYFYDGDGKRIKKVSFPGTTQEETVIFVYDASSKLIAEYSTNPVPASSAKVNYVTSDHLGSPRVNTDQDGRVTARHDYMPYGEEIARSSYGADSVRKKFTGYERDDETGLDFAQARYMNNLHGRFTSHDPFGPWAMSEGEKAQFYNVPQQWNRYAYVLNNPLRSTDPTGLEVYDATVSEDQQAAIRKALQNIAKNGNREQKAVANWILKSDILISLVGSSSMVDGTAGLESGSGEVLSRRIEKDYISKEEAASYLRISLNEGRVGKSDFGQAALEGLLNHEGRHAWVNALAIQSLSSDCGQRCYYSISNFTDELKAFQAEATYLLSRAQAGSVAAREAGLGGRGRYNLLSEDNGRLQVNEGSIRQILDQTYGLNESRQGGTTIQNLQKSGVRIPTRSRR